MLEKTDSLVVLYGVFGEKIDHPELGEIVPGTISFEFYWTNRWYNVFKFLEPNGRFRNFYCNICLPPNVSENCIDYVDLDIDLLVDENRNTRILDRNEFEENSLKFSYGTPVIKQAEETVSQLIAHIDDCKFPF